MDFEKMKEIDPRPVNKEELVDINTLTIDENGSKEERILQFLEQVKNPYLYRCKNLVVKSVFADTDVTLEERMKQYFRIV